MYPVPTSSMVPRGRSDSGPWDRRVPLSRRDSFVTLIAAAGSGFWRWLTIESVISGNTHGPRQMTKRERERARERPREDVPFLSR